jgi:hypothetical protein
MRWRQWPTYLPKMLDVKASDESMCNEKYYIVIRYLTVMKHEGDQCIQIAKLKPVFGFASARTC